MHRFTLGEKIRDKVSGLEGIASARLEYLNGCVQYCISPRIDKDGKRVEGWYVDQQTLELVGSGITGMLDHMKKQADINEVPASATGGPSTTHPRT